MSRDPGAIAHHGDLEEIRKHLNQTRGGVFGCGAILTNLAAVKEMDPDLVQQTIEAMLELSGLPHEDKQLIGATAKKYVTDLIEMARKTQDR